MDKKDPTTVGKNFQRKSISALDNNCNHKSFKSHSIVPGWMQICLLGWAQQI